MADHIDSALRDLLNAIDDLQDRVVGLEHRDPLQLAIARVYYAGQRVKRVMPRTGSRWP